MTCFRRNIALWTVLSVIALLMSGCMYRSEMNSHASNPAVIREEINRVQGAVDAFRKDRSVPPIKNSDQTTPLYEKYVIDLRKLAGVQYLSTVPQNAFENGGNYYYVLVDADTEPKVKLMDLVAFQAASDLERSVARYAQENGGRLPLGTEVSDGFYAVDFKALDEEPVQIRSMYSNHYLPFLLHESGTVGIDYGLDIMSAIQTKGITSPKPDEDLRKILVEDSFFVPVRSFPYVWRDEQPVMIFGDDKIVR